MTLLLPIDEIAYIARFVLKGLLAMAMVEICMPLTFIKGTVGVSTQAFALLIVVNPCSLIHSSIFLDHGSLPVTLTHFPLAKVVRFFREA